MHPQLGVDHSLLGIGGHAGRAEVVKADPRHEPIGIGGRRIDLESPTFGPGEVAGGELDPTQAEPAQLGADTAVIDLVRVGEDVDRFGPGYRGISW